MEGGSDYRKQGLQAVPEEVLQNKALTTLNLAENQLSRLPGTVGQLKDLYDLNLMSNNLEELPDEIGELHKLYRLGLKGNRLRRLPTSLGRLTSLVELYVTDNALESLPGEIGCLRSLRKLQASFNRLSSLPREMASMTSLELFRVAVNPDLADIPPELGSAPALCWLSIGGSKYSSDRPETGGSLVEQHQPLEVTEDATSFTKGGYLGSGASGDVYKGVYRGQECAIKVFRADVSPDGHCADELDILCSLDHPNITKVIAIIKGPTSGVIMRLVKGHPLADKPNFQSLLRCRWPEGFTMEPPTVLRIAADIASALAYLHGRGIAHGDVYAHNCIVDLEGGGHATLCDFGASFRYPKTSTNGVNHEALEARAYGLYLKELITHSEGGGDACKLLGDIADQCCRPDVSSRPTFAHIHSLLAT